MKKIELKNVYKSFKNKNVLNDFSLDVYDNEMLCIWGKSGCGKTTLLNIIGFMETIDKGTYIFEGKDNIKANSSKALKLYRNKIGFLFQNYALIDNKSVKYNLMLALTKGSTKNKVKQIEKVLSNLNISELMESVVYECSGGEQQRIAIARLLLQNSEIILADEPTGSLDNVTKQEIFDILKMLKNNGKTIIVVSHDKDLRNICDRSIDM